jgi:protein involved in polysaccharide export with SLBB domain
LRRIRALRDRFPDRQIVLPEEIQSRTESKEEYTVGIEDTLQISVWRYPDLSTSIKVLADGNIYLPVIGPVRASGLSILQLQNELRRRYLEVVPEPRVTVIPLQQNSRRILVSGRVTVIDAEAKGLPLSEETKGLSSVTLPGGVQVQVPAPQAQGPTQAESFAGQGQGPVQNFLVLARESSLIEILNRLRFASDADLHRSYIVRRGVIIPVDIQDLLEGDLSQNVMLEPRDALVVPPLERRKVYIFGEVVKPGPALVVGENLLDAVSQAGGLTPRADLALAYMARSNTVLPVDFAKLFRDGEPSQNVPIQDNDHIFIPSLVEKRVYVVGEVNRPGIVQYSGQMDLVSAMVAAGSARFTAKESAVHVIRGNLQDPLVMQVNMNRVWRGELGQPLPLQSGDIVFVPPTGLTSWNRILAQLLPSLVPLQIIAPFFSGAPQTTINVPTPAVQ